MFIETRVLCLHRNTYSDFLNLALDKLTPKINTETNKNKTFLNKNLIKTSRPALLTKLTNLIELKTKIKSK